MSDFQFTPEARVAEQLQGLADATVELTDEQLAELAVAGIMSPEDLSEEQRAIFIKILKQNEIGEDK